MNRFLWSLVTLLPLLFWDKFSRFLFAPADPSQAPAARPALARGVADFATAHGLSETAVAAITLAALAYSTIFGLATHLMLAEKGLGPRLNGLVGMVGGAGVVALWLLLAPKAAFSYSALFFAAIVGSTVVLAAACVVKAIVFARVDDYFSGASTPQRGASSARVAAVAARRR
ncbi:hypothetical protein [Methylocystis parvus]|uniref:hypothetical protein n=1 Tax=Methylocystis parvus TaxID=134 RepID=UPI003C72BE88